MDLDEVLAMFHKYNFHITKKDLEKLYKIVDEDRDSKSNKNSEKNK